MLLLSEVFLVHFQMTLMFPENVRQESRPMRCVLPLLLMMLSCAIAWADDENKPQKTAGRLEGTEAGESKELVPGIIFHWCPPGTFVMGDYGKKVDVELTKGFWFGETEVTQGQWQAIMETTPWNEGKKIKEGLDYPATYVNLDDALSFLEKLTIQERKAGRLPRSWKYALPTDAQWEYACRAGTTTTYFFGEDMSKLSEYAWWGGSDSDGNTKAEQYAHRVGQKKANPWGLKDVYGNVWEWCSDKNERKLQGGRDPRGPSTGLVQVIRGSGWSNVGGFRSGIRGVADPNGRSNDAGFRIAAVPE